jgi:hypothetical protein
MIMEILSFEGSNGSSKRKRGNRFIAIATIAALGFMGSTFAASVTLNNGSDIQYGQGVAGAAACDNAITVTPTNIFTNDTATSGVFYVDTITVVDSRTANNAGLANCAGKSIKLSAFNNVAGAAALFTCTFSNITWSSPTLGATVSNCPTGAAITNYTNGSDKGLQLAFSDPKTNPGISAGGIYKFTLESF